MDAPPPQNLSYTDHIKHRHENKGCLYAWCVIVVAYIFFFMNLISFKSYFKVISDVFDAVCSRCVAVSVAMRHVNAAWTSAAATALDLFLESSSCVFSITENNGHKLILHKL